MMNTKEFKGINFQNQRLTDEEFEECVFLNCSLAGVNLSQKVFIDCTFQSCDFSLANVKGALFNEVKFTDCKLLGVHFDDCKQFSFAVVFEKCNLSDSSFYKMKLKKILFKDCKLSNVEFSESDLTDAKFDNCDLNGAVFISSNLEKTDFYTSFNYSLDPEKNKLKKTRFSKAEVIGLLQKYDIVIRE